MDGIMNKELDQIKYPRGMKWTKQRKSVYEVLYLAKEPLNAHQIYHLAMDRLEAKGELTETNYAFSTIYRILNAFEESHIVLKSNSIGSLTTVYEFVRGDHMHYAVCLGCKKRILLPHCPFEHMDMHQAGEDFVVTGHKLEVYGYCKTCQTAN